MDDRDRDGCGYAFIYSVLFLALTAEITVAVGTIVRSCSAEVR